MLSPASSPGPGDQPALRRPHSPPLGSRRWLVCVFPFGFCDETMRLNYTCWAGTPWQGQAEGLGQPRPALGSMPGLPGEPQHSGKLRPRQMGALLGQARSHQLSREAWRVDTQIRRAVCTIYNTQSHTPPHAYRITHSTTTNTHTATHIQKP